MTLRDEFEVLGTEIRELARAWRALEVSVVEDRPPGDGLAVSDRLAEAVTEGVADLAPAVEVVGRRCTARSLHTTAAALLRSRRRIEDDFRSHLAMSALVRSVRGCDHQWRGWARSVSRGADRCAESQCGAEDAMLRCWREAVELAELDKCGASR
ncbi:hypothetical protein ORV05_16360 [Amycolatopsis cynarae]|uniref:DUF222 domain-containing protein n=1 Tax=Amycolatopsis cynarae TaxID=2995223 RepID=A0ABY7BED7_9PSEU|nr:hypothetical protein [Amycolatopsis sp. HUAS 11-8]WAL69271.1 hypothetical protein ORV05_16360 [Amycolatopsis sp. HUAS 11-8]